MEAGTETDITVPPQTARPSLHRRILPYYLDNYVEQRPVIVSAASLPGTSLPQLPEERRRRPETCSIPLRGIDYTQTSLGVHKSHANTHRCPPGDEMCELCVRHFAKRQPNGYETFLNHIVTHLGHRPEFKQNAKRYIIHKPHPHLPAFIFSKCLHPKFFSRDVRKPREREHRVFQGRIRTPKKSYQNQRDYRTAFNRCQNSPETTLDSTGKYEKINLQSSDDNDTDATRRKSVSKNRKKKKHRSKSGKRKKSKSKQEEKDGDSKAGSIDEELTDSDSDWDELLKGEYSSSRKGIVKKEKKQWNRERNAKGGNEERAASDENVSNIPEKNSDEDEKAGIKIEMKPSPLPQYQPKPPPPQIPRNPNKQKMFMPPRQEPTNNAAPTKNSHPSMFSYFGQSNKEAPDNTNKIYSWLQRQLDFSLQACRFELPIDGRVLENVTPEDYLRRFCVVTPQFQSLYQKVFRKYQRPQMMNFKDLERALRAVAVNNFSPEKMEMVQTMTGVDEGSSIDYKLFCGIAALTERVSPVQSKRWEVQEKCEEEEGEEEEEEEHMSRERIETADFSALDWKLKNVEIGDKMKRILWTICS